ncbi:MAG: class I SAM-dependent methyltransferase [Desulfomonile tiedjei]|uniref:Class I SAM-dependent methyltransferase n=1 Tax=Desulfomonile tiedjei TaxID=2358 RepID=A0A9D6Z4J8_9BACT|nr:class I SAM-dependent methyltransferase [Desulfomonile tiedjei]
MDPKEQMQFFHEMFDSSLPRLGPGDHASTRKAMDIWLSAMPRREGGPNPTKLRILDLGCGNGTQTIQLANHLDGTILAVDNHQPYLDELKRRAEAAGVSEKIRTYLRDMCDLGLEDGSFDLIWSEGAIFVMGFRKGLETCHGLLAAGGGLALSELVWLRPDPPAECRQYFADVYPVIVDNDTNLATIRDCGFEVLGHFSPPESAWLECCYAPMEDRLQSLEKMYALDPERMKMIESIHMEIENYRKYSSYYGYMFYIMQRR